MSSSVCYFYFGPVIGERQLMCYAVILLWFLIVISLFDMTVVTEENLHNNNEYVKWEWKLIFNEFVKCATTYM